MSVDVDEKLFTKLRECLSKALGLDAEEIEINSSLTRDLGAESIDFLDIVFRIEQTFNIKIPRSDLFPENFLSSNEYVQKGLVTPAGLEYLQKQFSFTDYTEFSKNPKVSELTDTFTVKSLIGYLKSRLTPDQIKV